jgi:predicted nucleic acid-binding protein
VSSFDLRQLPIHVDAETDQQEWNEKLLLAVQHQLTLCDAAYLEPALRRSLPLATLDEELRWTAKTEKVQLLG